VRLAPGSVSARTNLAVLYTRQRRLDDAVTVLREAAAVRPDDVRVLLTLALAERERGSRADSLATLERAVALAPGSSEAHFWLAREHLEAGEGARAEPHLAALERLDPPAAARLRAARP
jgi:Flp pilus assembly protein TadD